MSRFTENLRFPKGRMNHVTAALGVALIFVLGYALGIASARTSAQDGGFSALSPEAAEAFHPLFQIYNVIEDQYVEPIDPSVLINGAADGMVNTLNDQFSAYMDPETFPLLNSDLAGQFDGIGVVITTDETTNEITIVGLLQGTPAASSGLMPGDVFVAVNGQDIAGWNQAEFAAEVRGPEGTTVDLTIRRGEDLLDFTVERAHIVVPNVESRLVDDGQIAYIRLNNFSDDANTLVRQAIEDLDVNSRQGLIFDLRDNPGGLLSSAVSVSSLFVQSGTVVQEDFGDGNVTQYSATGEYAGISVPVVLLVNRVSASASEIVAGALQDLDLATLIGETTFGKGSVQTWQPLSNGGGVRITIARWLTPTGRWINGQGVTPDIQIDFTPAHYEDLTDEGDIQLDAAIRYLSGEQVDPIIEATPEATAEATIEAAP
ncbi:MAG: S41 family peptidase [Anaerolineae bacterium]